MRIYASRRHTPFAGRPSDHLRSVVAIAPTKAA
jgi:hypothetical protein